MSNYVIIGASAAGIHAAEEIRTRETDAVITMLSDEPFLPYRRYRLADMLSGKARERELIYRGADFFTQQRIEVMKPCKAERVNPDKKYVQLDNKNRLNYDCLIIASGVRTVLPREIKGTQRFGVAGFRTLGVVKDIQDLIPISHLACVWGSGVAGVQAAAAFKARGLDVRIVEPQEQLLKDVVSAEAAEFIAERLSSKGIEIIIGQNIVELMGNGDVKAVRLSKGKVIGCGIVAVDMFYNAQADFLSETAVAVGPEGIVADEFLCASVPTIFCAGDAALVKDAVTGNVLAGRSWAVAVEQGALAGRNAVLQAQGRASERQKYPGIISAQRFNCLDMTILAVGRRSVEANGNCEMLVSQEPGAYYRNIIVQGNRLVGYTCAGASAPEAEPIVRLIREQVDISALKDRLLAGDVTLPEPAGQMSSPL